MEPRTQRRVAGRVFAARPANLSGYRRETPADGYPYVLPDPHCTVAGILLDDVDPSAWRRLDAYEEVGRLYVRRTATADVDGRGVRCQVYVGAAIAGHGQRG